MNKDAFKKERWNISDLVSRLPEDQITEIEPQGDRTVSPAGARIKERALQKRRESLNRNEEPPMKKVPFGIALVAVLVCLLSVTAFAAFGGLEYIKGIFGDSAQSIQHEIQTPSISASADGREMALEALVTDGFVTNMVVSLTGNRPAADELFSVTTDLGLRSNGWYVMEGFSTSRKTFYVVDLVSEQRFDTADVTLSLNRDVAPIDLLIPVENYLGNAVVQFPAGAVSGRTALRELQISPMGFLLIGQEGNVQGGLPSTQIHVVFSDGSTEDIEVDFAPSDETVGGAGGAVIGGGNTGVPLVTMFQGTRNPDGELVINGQFSRIINPTHIESVEIEGVVYQVTSVTAE